MEKLFDIAACKCEFSACKCEKVRKVPIQEQKFLSDQSSSRKMSIRNIDREETKKLTAKKARQSTETERLEKYRSGSYDLTPGCSTQVSTLLKVSWHLLVRHPMTIQTLKTYLTLTTSKCTHTQMRLKLPTLGIVCDKYGVSDRSAAAIATAVLKDVGIVSADDPSKIIDKNKVRRVRQKNRNIV